MANARARRGTSWYNRAMARLLLALAMVAPLLACKDAAPADDDANHGGGGAGGSAGAGPSGGQGGAGGSGGGCADDLPVDDDAPSTLSATGLYSDIGRKQLAPRVRPFTPQFELWSDGADKARWIYLPECDGVIDTSTMDDWSLPVGTRLWKEFSVNGQRIETRLLARTGPGPDDFLFTSYLWSEDGADAARVPDGQPNALGTEHDVPAEDVCFRCHGSHGKGGGRPSRALGFSALQLAHAGDGATLTTLADEGRLSSPPPTLVVAVPGDPVAQAALGYLHANCGHCHNDTVDRVPQVELELWLPFEVSSVTESPAFVTTVGVPNAIFNDPTVSARIAPGNPEESSVWFRMAERGNNAQMPPVGSERTDPAGLAALHAWIGSLP